MGIQGLIPFLEKSSRQVNVRQYSGCCVAIDAYCWLHKGTYTCADKLARGEQSTAYVFYCMKYVHMLLSHNIKPILVFDGRHLPAKALTEKKRRENREITRKRAAELLRAGRTDEARSFLRRCIDVTHEMALALIKECRKLNVDCIVAPYEADAQLAYLNLKNIAQIVITEDSDLVLFGCTKVLFKMDLGGTGLLVEQERLHMAMKVRPENFSFAKFRYMCILSGCDYLPSLPGIGLSKACKFIKRIMNPDIHKALSRLPAQLNMGQLSVTEEYRDNFLRADETFRFQLVYDPLSRHLVPLTALPGDQRPLDHVGKPLPGDVALQLALGNLDPLTLMRVDDYDPDAAMVPQGGKTNSWQQKALAPHPSIWSRNYTPSQPAPKEDPCSVAHPTTRGKMVTKDVKLLVNKRPEQGALSELCSDATLTSLYNEPASKRPCVHKHHPSILSEELAGSAGTNDGTLMSPVSACKSRRNPFAVTLPKSPPKPESSWSKDVLSEPKKKFSALTKFGRFQRTVIEDNVVVRSRYFAKEEKSEEKAVGQFMDKSQLTDNCMDSSPSLLHDVSNIVINVKPDVIHGVCNNSISSLTNNLPLQDKFSHHSLTENVGDCRVHSPSKACSIFSALGDISDFNDKVGIVRSPCKVYTNVFNINQFSPRKVANKVCGSRQDKVQPSFKWQNMQEKFSFQLSNVSLGCTTTVERSFKNPFRKEDHEEVDDPSKDAVLQLGNTGKENHVSVEDGGILAGFPTPISVTAAIVNEEAGNIKMESSLMDNGSRKLSLPSVSKLSASLKPVSQKSKSCRRPGLSKGSSRQQTLLHMFGFQKKEKLLHT